MVRASNLNVAPTCKAPFRLYLGRCGNTPPLSDLSQDRDRFLLIAHSVKATYDHMARKMELLARLIINKENRRVVVKHNCGDSQQYLGQLSNAASLKVSDLEVAPRQARGQHRLRHPVARSDPLNLPTPPEISRGLDGASGAMTPARVGTGGMTADAATNLAVSERGSAIVRLCRLH